MHGLAAAVVGPATVLHLGRESRLQAEHAFLSQHRRPAAFLPLDGQTEERRHPQRKDVVLLFLFPVFDPEERQEPFETCDRDVV